MLPHPVHYFHNILGTHCISWVPLRLATGQLCYAASQLRDVLYLQPPINATFYE